MLGLLPITVCSLFAIYAIHRFLHLRYVTGQPPEQTLRVMSWNIGKLYLSWDSRAADRDLNYVADVIREVDPHVVALQEIRGPTQLGRLLTLLGPQWIGRVPTDAYDRRAALLTRLPARFFQLPTSSGRTAQGGEVRLRDGLEVSFVSLHLDAFDADRRLRQAEELLASLRRSGRIQTVLAGDFNFDPAMAKHGSPEQRLYSLLTDELHDAARRSGVTTVFSRRLDYIFYAGQRLAASSARVLRGRRINTMDHDPLVVELVLHRARHAAQP